MLFSRRSVRVDPFKSRLACFNRSASKGRRERSLGVQPKPLSFFALIDCTVFLQEFRIILLAERLEEAGVGLVIWRAAPRSQ